MLSSDSCNQRSSRTAVPVVVALCSSSGCVGERESNHPTIFAGITYRDSHKTKFDHDFTLPCLGDFGERPIHVFNLLLVILVLLSGVTYVLSPPVAVPPCYHYAKSASLSGSSELSLEATYAHVTSASYATHTHNGEPNKLKDPPSLHTNWLL